MARILEFLIRLLSRNRIFIPVRFPEHKLVVRGEPLRRMFRYGALLRVPPVTCAVVMLPQVNPRAFLGGEYIVRFNSIQLDIQYIDLRPRVDIVTVEDALSSDGFILNIELQISWRFRDNNLDQSLQVALMRDPIQEVCMIVKNAIRLVTAAHTHDELAPLPGNVGLNENALREEIITELNLNQVFANAIVLRWMILTNRKGDPKRTEIAHEIALHENATRLEEQKFIQQQNVVQNEITLENIKRQNERNTAVLDRDFELDQANFEVEREIRRRPLLEQNIELKTLKKAPEFRLQREKNSLEARTSALTPITQIIAHLLGQPGASGMYDHVTIDRLSRIFEYIVSGLWDNPDVITAEYRHGPVPPGNAKEALIYKLIDLLSRGDYLGHRTYETPDGLWILRIFIKDRGIAIWYNLAGINPAIKKIIFTNLQEQNHNVPNPEIYNRIGLSELIDRLITKFG